jgi:hypothetical protein
MRVSFLPLFLIISTSFAIFDAELRVKQHRFMRAGNEVELTAKMPFSCGL